MLGYSDAVRELRPLGTRLNRSKTRSIFLFVCGGDGLNPEYVARDITERYLASNECGRGVVCVRPESVLDGYGAVFADWDLLALEKLIASVSDAVLLFDESPGSLCELGAFSACDPIAEVTTAFVPSKHRDEPSFVALGPLRRLESIGTELSGVIYGDVSCPTFSEGLCEYFVKLRGRAKARKKLNAKPGKVDVGSFCIELLDLISVFAPLTPGELERVYREYKRFGDSALVFADEILGEDARRITTEVAVCFLAACGLVCYRDGLVSMAGVKIDHFMFNGSSRERIMRIRARMLASKRRGRRGCHDVCFGADGEGSSS